MERHRRLGNVLKIAQQELFTRTLAFERGGGDDSLDDSGERQGSDGRLPVEALVVETALAKARALAAEARTR